MATISNIAHFEGIGLHTGENVKLNIHPADTGHGVVFVRTDIESRPKVPASIDYIDYRQRRTALVNDGVEIQTPEHFLAACYGLGIDNLLVEISGPELPGADGSALPFCQALMDAGIEEQGTGKTIKIDSELQVDRDKASIKAMPDTGFHIEYTLDHDLDFFPKQVFSLEITKDSFIKEIAPARTFVLKKEVEALQKFGLGKGATVKNTLVIDDDGSIIDNELRFADEFTRHKILDIVGDFFLLGARLEGKLYAHRSGHNLNALLVEKIQACQS
ncbi:UDP-3-O-acyl-N-acetylglucosamine deacetylase [Candidatus Uabimicrobium amorphum]|uniref:UDP-3-O-acyl-N-acetylglucosamine deacetylase n=1 Tax=Uabimicrobium amorphum TaxID=2596890 RepID=A0A5S9IHS4_UABAM|nr:UDP-3-O-acyl-N-acetylglucosamine deacetylase [Candidatus Uabimicrobium amorphum]BBM81827.1 UDP-3-O-acyl-N-acetylglucosamine deacetylase [Candidatus Uabimicrobium amorphum]